MVNLTICSATSKRSFYDTVLSKSLQKMSDVNVISLENNKKTGLSQFYNECIERFKDAEKLVFVHDDVDIINKDLDYQVTQALKMYDVVGVAGCINPKIIERNLWHWMAGDIKNCRGIAGHPYDEKSFHVTAFGPTPSRVAIVDGVFIAMNPSKIYQSGTKFDPQFTFHHYDIDFSLTCNKNGHRIGVYPILINHQSPGLKEFNQTWNDSNQKFITKWKSK